jgi:putative transposase
VWRYHLFGFSLRDVELILTARGIVVSREGIRRWVSRFGTDLARKLRKRRLRLAATSHHWPAVNGTRMGSG